MMGLWLKTEEEKQLAQRLAALALLTAFAALFFGFLASQLLSWRWPIAVFFSVTVGHIACESFITVLRSEYMRIPKPAVLGRSRGVPPWLVGLIESLVFSVAVGISVQASDAPTGVLTVMGLWLAEKMLAGWNRDVSVVVKDEQPKYRAQWLEERSRGAFAAILTGVFYCHTWW